MGTGHWVYGDLLLNNGFPIIVVQVERNYIGTTDTGEGKHWHIETPAFRVDPKTVGQFTGLLDKNGKEIWEGDILSQDPFLKVVFENGGFCFSNDLLSGSDRLSQERVGRLEIIGNIHETL